MKKQFVKPVHHGIIDYGFSAIQIYAPKVINLNEKSVEIYRLLGTGFLTVNALTDTPAGLKRTISFKNHQKIDAAFLTTLSLLTFSNPIRKHKKVMCFHLGFLSVAIAHYILTDYKGKSGKN